jgi:hypothetical protein
MERIERNERIRQELNAVNLTDGIRDYSKSRQNHSDDGIFYKTQITLYMI